MLRKYYKNNFSSTHRPTQMVATCQNLSRHKIFRDGDKFSFSRLLSDGEFQLTDPRSAKLLDEVVEEVQKSVYWFLRSCRKTYFCRNL